MRLLLDVLREPSRCRDGDVCAVDAKAGSSVADEQKDPYVVLQEGQKRIPVLRGIVWSLFLVYEIDCFVYVFFCIFCFFVFFVYFFFEK